jgi:hypothetical protein
MGTGYDVESLFFDKLFVIMLLSFMFLIEWTFCFV